MDVTKNCPFDKNGKNFGMMPTSCQLNARFTPRTGLVQNFFPFVLPD